MSVDLTAEESRMTEEQRVHRFLDLWQQTFQDFDQIHATSTTKGQARLLASDLRAVLESLDDYRNAYRQRGGVIPEPSREIARRAIREWKFPRTRRGHQ